MSGSSSWARCRSHTVYLHGTVRDTQHRKMSKSLGNGIDPLEVVERYGADALRYTLVSGMSVGTDVILDPDDLETSFAPGRNFANKLWNAGRFILSNLDGPPRPLAGGAANAVRRGRAHAGRPLDHRALRRHGARGDRGVRAVPAQRGGRGGLPLPLERPGRLVHRADQAAALRRRAGRRRGAGRRGPDVRRGAPAAPPGDAVRHRGALAPVPRAAGRGLDLGGALARCPTRGRRMPTALARVRPGAGGGGRHPRHPRRVRRAAGPDRARVRDQDGGGRDRRRSSASAAPSSASRSSPSSRFGESARAGRRPRGAPRRHRGVRPARRRDRRRTRVRAAGRRGRAARRSSSASQEKKLGNEQFVSRAPADVVRARAREARRLDRAARGADRKRELLGCG